jgi:glutathione S-transferase
VGIKLYELCGAEPDRLFSPNCWRSRLALAHKGLDVETVPVRFGEKDKIAFSGQTLVPVLDDGGKVVPDSWAIAGYLEDTYGDRPSLFGGAGGRGLTRFVNEWVGRGLFPALIRILAVDIYNHLTPADQTYFRQTREKYFGTTLEALTAEPEKKIAALNQVLEPLRGLVKAQPFVAGDRPAYADYTAFCGFQWARCISAKRLLAADDPVHAWRGRMLALYGGLAGNAKGYPC